MKFLVFCSLAAAFINCLYAVDSLRFILLGDMGGLPIVPYSTYIERSTAQEMGKLAEEFGPNFIMEVGDNFYLTGVTDVNDPRFQLTFEDVFTADSLQVPWYLIAGNHDHYGNVSAQVDYTRVSPRWNFPSLYYYFEQPIPGDKKAGFLMIDTIELCGNTDDDSDKQPSGPASRFHANTQWDFIQATLTDNQADYLFVVGHFPIYSIAEHGPTACLVDDLLPLLHKHGVNGYFCGHDHNLQHLQIPSKSDKVKYIDFVVSGMANFINRSTKHAGDVPDGSSRFHYAERSSRGGFMTIEATAHNMTMIFYSALGDRLYNTAVYPRNL